MNTSDRFLSLQSLGARVPRYTSYPPATQFTDAVGPDRMALWLGEIGHAARISLYVHIPFCRRLCWFCACRTQGARSDAPLWPYVDALALEIALVADHLPGGVTVEHLHLGGGTPTFLPAPLMDRLFAQITSHFSVAQDAEISVEVDPTEIDAARLDALAAAGVTRASLGVQDFDPLVQTAIGREQSFEATQSTVTGLRDRGISKINLDLLYGLPHQTPARLGRTLEDVIRLNPDRLALYGYAHVPWASKRQVMIDEAALPDGVARVELTRQATDRLLGAGFEAVGIDHFARPEDPMAQAARAGTLRRNFQGYTCDQATTLIGIGASAISHMPGGIAQNASRTGDWKARIQEGRLATVRGHAFCGEDRLRGAMIERVMCDFALDPDQFADPEAARAICAQIQRAWPDTVEACARGGVRLRPGSELLARLIAAEIDVYKVDPGRHSLAV